MSEVEAMVMIGLGVFAVIMVGLVYIMTRGIEKDE